LILDKHYINEAKRIRENYFDNLKFIEDKSEKLTGYKNEIEKIKSEMEDIYKESVGEPTVNGELNKKLLEIEKYIVLTQDEIRPFYEKILKLRDDSMNLYNSIVEKYPDIDKEDIKKQIIENLD
jgi:uncharacterized coiled-coil protein SlyX